jgi:flagellin-like protein
MAYKKNKKASQGIGTLIIFIAMILVAAVAAFVLISTASKLQGKAETTGDQIQQRLATGFSLIEVLVSDTSDAYINTTLDNFEVALQLAPGADPVKVSDVTFTLVTQDGASSYSYAAGAATVTTFNVTYDRGPEVNGYVSAKDVVRAEFSSSTEIGESEDFTIRIFPGSGSPQPVSIVTPPSMLDVYTVLK